MAAQVANLYHALPDWTRSHAVIAGYNTLKVSLVHKPYHGVNMLDVAHRPLCMTFT